MSEVYSLIESKTSRFFPSIKNLKSATIDSFLLSLFLSHAISSTMTSKTGFSLNHFMQKERERESKGEYSKNDSKKPVFRVFVHKIRERTASMKNVE